MTDKKYITNYLDKNYFVTQSDNNFRINEVGVEVTHVSPDIFSDFISDENVSSLAYLFEWFDAKKNFLIKDLSEFVSKLKRGTGSTSMLKRTLKKFNKNEYSETFLTKYIEEIYTAKFLENVFNDYKKNIDCKIGSVALVNEFFKKHKETKKLTIHITKAIEAFYKETILTPELNTFMKSVLDMGSQKMIDKFLAKSNFETPAISDYIVEIVNDWYHVNLLKDKLNELTSQLVITLMKQNWRVTWIGHGELTKEKFYDFFKDETVFLKKIANREYEKWYEEAVISASEKMMGIIY